MWVAVLIASVTIQVLFVIRIHPHPKNLWINCKNKLSSLVDLVPEESREQAELNHAEVLRLNQRFVRGFREVTNVAFVIMLISVAGIVLEVKKRKI